MGIKVVFHVDEVDKWGLVIANVKNLLNGIEIDQSAIEIVANSKAVSRYVKTQENEETIFEELSKKGVLIVACNNALNSLSIKKETLYSFVKIVPIGVKELIEKQQEGYAYIKP
jgi:intracellular sulfur oxidation DsrE/DsrF family protein